MRRKKFDGRALILALCVAVIALPGAALAVGSSKGRGEGGSFAVYLPIVAKYNKSGEPFRIEGACKSACTLFLSIRHVCVDRKAFLSFHAGPDRVTKKWGPNSSSTRTMLAAYKPKLREYLVGEHHVDSRAYHTLTGAILIDKFGYAECKPR